MHASPAEVTPDIEAPDQPPTAPGRPASGGPQRAWLRRGLVIAAAAAIIVGAIVLLVIRGKTPTAGNRAQYSSANATQVLRLKGTTEAVQSRAILAPVLEGQQVPTLTIIRLAPAGTRVKPGDLLVEFDRQAQMRDFVDKQAEYRKLVDQVAEEQAKENAARAKDETELKQAEDNLRKAELEVQKAELVSKIDAEKNQESLEEARATYDQLRETFDLKRKAALAGIRILEIQRDRTQQTMMHAQANSELMQIHAPIEGVVVLNTIWKGGTMGDVQEGDRVEPGTPFMQVVNPAAMQVRVEANQQDFPSLQIGQTAKVRLDAYPDLVFPGNVEQLAPIGEHGSFSDKLRAFAVIVSIRGNDPKLMPDLSAAVDVDVAGGNAGAAAKQDGKPGTGGGS
jgi:multidrug efflux pump subunit AcrA (membrane-fusion protein)